MPPLFLLAATSLGALVTASDGGTTIQYGIASVEIRETDARVENVESGHHQPSGTLFVTWDEVRGPERQPWFALSEDGGRTFMEPQPAEHAIKLRYHELHPGEAAPRVPPILIAPGSELFIVQFVTVATDGWRQSLADLGVRIFHFMPHQGYIVRMDPSLAARVAALPWVRYVGPYHPAYRLEERILEELSNGRDELRLRNVLAMEESRKSIDGVVRAVRRAGGQVAAVPAEGMGALVEALLTATQAVEAARSDHVFWIDVAGTPEHDMNIVRQFSGVDYIQSVGEFQGFDVRGEVLDGGANLNHPDLLGTLPHPGWTFPTAGFGTESLGILFGSGAGNPAARGMLPRANTSGVGQAYAAWYSAFSTAQRKAFTSELIQPPMYCVFQSNSWGNARTSQYNSYSQLMDDIVLSFDLTICQSFGNGNRQEGRPEAWAKNVIAVGGICHANTISPADDGWCGASTGPAADGRIKPDLAHFYDGILTTSNDGYIGTWGGSSAATAITCGAVGLLHEVVAANVLGTNPGGLGPWRSRLKPPTVRAILEQQAFRYPIGSTTGTAQRDEQGFGIPDLQNVYDNALRMSIVDETAGIRQGETHTYCIGIPAATPDLLVSMSFMDFPGTTSASVHRVNDLSLRVVAPGGQVFHGNNGLRTSNWSSPGGSPDTSNPKEHVFIPNPAAGNWTIEVTATEINADTRPGTDIVDADYALVVTGVACPNLSCCL